MTCHPHVRRPLALALLITVWAAPLTAAPARAEDACVPPQSALTDVRVDGSVLAFCSADETARACWQVDVAAASARWITVPLRRAASPEAPAEPGAGVRACTTAGAPCIDFSPPVPPAEDASVRGTLSPDGTVVAIWGGGPMTFYEVATKKVLFTIKPWKTPMGDPSFFQGVTFVGPSVAVAISWTPVSSAARLFDAKTGRAIGPVGPRGTDLDECAPLHLGGDRWVFVTFMAGRLVIENVRTGKVVRTIKAADGPPMTGAQHLARLPDGQVLLVPYTPDIPMLVADPKTGRTTKFAFPLCGVAAPETRNPAPRAP